METLLLTLALLALAVIAGTKLGTALVARSVKPGAMERRREEGMRERSVPDERHSIREPRSSERR